MNINKIVSNKKSFILGILGLIVIITILELTNLTHFFHKQKVAPVIPAQTGSGQPISSSNSSSDASSPNSTIKPPASVTNHTLVTPFGNFVSNHYPGQNGTNTSEVSVCNTSPGATCYIKFTNTTTGQIANLPAQVADARGSVSWYWDINKDAHLTNGEWTIKAIATLGSQTKTAVDNLNIKIQ